MAEFGSADAQVLVGEIGSVRSQATMDHPTIGLDLTVRPSVNLPTDPSFEHGVIPIDRSVRVEATIVDPGSLAIIPSGADQLRIETRGSSARLMLLGGEPLGTRVKMWWNFVARTTDEITAAWHDWQVGNEDRFGPVPSSLERMEAPRPPWLRADD